MFLKLQKQNRLLVISLVIFFGGFLFFWNVNNSNAVENNLPGALPGEHTTDTLYRQASDGSNSYGVEGASLVTKAKIDEASKGAKGSCSLFSTSFFECFLLKILQFVGLILSMANTIFEWCVDTKNWAAIFQNPAIYACWGIVRDLLNISFIIVLLYTAFTIIFQTDSTGKKTLLTIALMALLVNFSFPITLFIIDISNSLMYTIINTLNLGGSGTGGAMGVVMQSSGVQDIMYPPSGAMPTIPVILASIVFVFILAITILAVGLLLVVRMVTLAILLIFSPIAYVARILPETKKYSSTWWTKLFENAIFGPAMLLGVYVAVSIIKVQSAASLSSFVDAAGKQTKGASVVADANVIGSMAWFAIPIIILWYVMGQAKGSGVAGASMIMGQAEKFAKGTPMWAFNKTGIPGGMKQRWATFKKTGFTGTDAAERRAAAIASLGSGNAFGRFFGGDDSAKQALQLKRMKEAADGHDMENMTIPELNSLRDGGSQYEKAAAIKELANRGKATEKDLEAMKKTFGETSQVFKQLVSKVKNYDPVAAFAHVTNGSEKMKEFIGSNQFDAKKINANSWKDKDFMELALTKGGVSSKDMEDVLKRNPNEKTAIKGALTIAANNHVADNEEDKAIQSIHFAQVGSISSNAVGQAHILEHVFSNLNGENGANIKDTDAATFESNIFNNIKPGKLLDFARGIKNVDAQRTILSGIKTRVRANQPGYDQRLVNNINKDPALSRAYSLAP